MEYQHCRVQSEEGYTFEVNIEYRFLADRNWTFAAHTAVLQDYLTPTELINLNLLYVNSTPTPPPVPNRLSILCHDYHSSLLEDRSYTCSIDPEQTILRRPPIRHQYYHELASFPGVPRGDLSTVDLPPLVPHASNRPTH